MKIISPPKRRLFELLGMIVIAFFIWLLYPGMDASVLFCLGFIWNWSASNDLNEVFENRRYKFSMLKTVTSIQQTVVRPFEKLPLFVRKLIAVLPAGTFWTLVIFMNESEMPWWATFLGSIAFELLQIELKFEKGQKETL